MTNNHIIEIKLKEYNEFSRYINSMGLSIRATNVILHNCFSLEDFASLDKESLYAFQNCGRKTVREIISFLETIRETDDIHLPLSTKEQLAKPPTESSISLLPLFSSRRLEDVTSQDLHPDFHASIKLTDIVLSVRTAKVLNCFGLETLGEVMLTSAAVLLRRHNFGRKSLNELREIVRAFCLTGSFIPGNDLAESPAIDYSSYEIMVSGFVQQCEKNKRNQTLFLKRFCFQEGKAPTLEELGQHFEISRERARQILKKGTAKFQIKAVFEKVTFFWQTLDRIVAQGGGIIHLGALPAILQSEFNWPTVPYPLALGQLLLLRDPSQSLKNNSDLITVDCQCQACEQPLQQLQSLDFDSNESFHLQVISLNLSNYCQHTCPWKQPVTTFHRAFVEYLVDQSDDRLVLHGDVVLPYDRWLGKYCDNLEDVTCHVLESHGEPMHFREIAAAIRRNNKNFFEISDHNVHAAIMRYTNNIEIINRGSYGLKSWGIGGYRSVSTAIEAIIDEKGLPQRKLKIIKKLAGEFSEGNITASLLKETRFVSIGGGFYDRPQNWQKRFCSELIQLLPKSVAEFARYLVNRNNTSYKLVMAFIFIRSMNEYGAIYLSNLKQMFYNFYLSRHKKGLVVEVNAALMNRIGVLPASEIKNKATKEPLKSFLGSEFFKNFSQNGGKLGIVDPLIAQLGNPSVKDVLLITILKAIDDYFQQITPTVAQSVQEAGEHHKVAEPHNTFQEKMEKSETTTPTLNIKKKGRGKIKL